MNWVLQDINFSANRGEAIGIIGRNGAGKSTLLRLLCENIKPSCGEITKNGNVSAILELGMGFHPEFTGRQNVLLEAKIKGVFNSTNNKFITYVEEFADIGRHFDEPVKIYSSGMISRLAFAISTANDPDILVVDEALSVGDLSFQSKCLQRMRQLKENGTCILFVSHSLNLIREFCDRALYISDGIQKDYGTVESVCDHYENDIINPSSSKNLFIIDSIKPNFEKNLNLRKNSAENTTSGSYELEFTDFSIMDSNMNPICDISWGSKVFIKVDIFANKSVSEGTAVGLLFSDKAGYHLLSCNSNLYDKYLPSLNEGQRISMIWEFDWPFCAGQFRVDVGMKPNPFENYFYDRIFCVSTIETYPSADLVNRNFGGYLFVNAKVECSSTYD